MELIGPLQLRVMHHIWKHGPCTVHMVHDALNHCDQNQQLAYTTVLTVMRNLARRSILSQTPNGRSHVFSALIGEREYKTQLLQYIRGSFFNGDLMEMLAALTADHSIPTENREALQQMLD